MQSRQPTHLLLAWQPNPKKTQERTDDSEYKMVETKI